MIVANSENSRFTGRKGLKYKYVTVFIGCLRFNNHRVYLELLNKERAGSEKMVVS